MGIFSGNKTGLSDFLSATISYHKFQSSSLMLMSAICANETTNSIENINKVKIVSTMQFQNASFVSCISV